MPEFRIHTAASAPAASQGLLRGLSDQVGFVPNLAATMSESPILLQAFLGLRSAAAGSLEPVAREVTAITVAVETGCAYCVAAHSTFALKSGASVGVVEAARSGAVLDDPRLQALAHLARAVVRRQPDVRERVQDAFSAGLTPVQVLETLVAIATPMLASTVAQLADVPLDSAFRPQAWTRRA